MTHLIKTERQEIYLLKQKGYSLREIAKALARSPSTISRELQRNTVFGKYHPAKAHHKSYTRWKYRKLYLKKILAYPDMENFLRQQIIRGWSPEQVAGVWNRTHSVKISPLTIYKYIYSDYGIGLTKYLLTKRIRKRKRIPKRRDHSFLIVFGLMTVLMLLITRRVLAIGKLISFVLVEMTKRSSLLFWNESLDT